VKSPGFTLAAVATLALGIGANTAVFSVVRAVLLRPLPFRDPGRLVVVWEDLFREGNHRFSVAAPNFEDLRAQSDVFDGLAAQIPRGVNLTGAGEPEPIRGAGVTGNYFAVLGRGAAIGRTLVPEDERQHHRVAVLSDALWRRRFGAEPSAVGTLVRLDGESFTVVGIMPKDFAIPSHFKAPESAAEFWIPLDLPPAWNNRATAVLQLVGRWKAGASLAKTRDDVDRVARRLAVDHPETNAGVRFAVVPVADQIVGGTAPILRLLLGAVALLLVIACANLSSLLLARALARRPEVAIRIALGAGRRRLFRQLLTESLLLGLLGGIVALVCFSWGVDALRALAPSSVPRLDGVRLDAWVAGFAAALSLVVGVAFGIAPALQAARLDVRSAMAGARGSGRRPADLRGALVIGQMALALVLLVGAGLMLQAVHRLSSFDIGFRSKGVLSFRIGLPPSKYATPESRLAFFDDLFGRLERLPSVVAAGGTTRFPIDPAYGVGSLNLERRLLPPSDRPVVGVRVVSPDYFRALGIPLWSGRPFGRGDRAETTAVALVNRAFVARFSPDRSPISQRLALGSGEPSWRVIVGVTGDVSHDGIDSAAIPAVYLPLAQSPERGLNVVVQTFADAAGLAPTVRQTVAALDPELPLVELRPMSARLEDALGQPRFVVRLLGGFAILAVLLACLGLHALMAQDVARRRREIAIRVALGASRRQVVDTLLVRAGLLLAAGLSIGVAGALAATRLLAGLLHGIRTTDAGTYFLVAPLFAAAAIVAAWIPARRAVRVSPASALRSEP